VVSFSIHSQLKLFNPQPTMFVVWLAGRAPERKVRGIDQQQQQFIDQQQQQQQQYNMMLSQPTNKAPHIQQQRWLHAVGQKAKATPTTACL
jgi:hypothetical protein